jgi:decaprenylphospho-beta-D-ribofuranose 2-oxidase
VATLLGARPARGVLARGLGRSYNDAAQNAGGLVLDMTACDRLLDLDHAAGTVTCEAGVSLDTLIRWLLPAGWFVPVTPGTRAVTVGGAIAADIHGKNHHRDASISRHVRSLDLVGADGTERRLTPADSPREFWATAGGMGLTGVVVRATLALIPVTSSLMRVDTRRCGDLDAVMAALEDSEGRHRYSVAWIDGLARGGRLGRGVVTGGEHACADELPADRRPAARAFSPRTLLRAPSPVPDGLLRPSTVGAFNAAYYAKAPRHRDGELQSLSWFFHPLDLVAGWNGLYGPYGLVQHQFVVPLEADATVREAVQRLSDARSPAFLAVLKRFGPATPGPLSFPRPGWTLAMDLPASMPGVRGLLDELDELVVAAGGAVYLAKDARVRPELIPAMYPRLEEFRDVRRALDPHGRFRSDLARRLSL